MAEILGNYLISGVCHAFDAQTVGSRVVQPATLMDYLDEFMPLHDVPGHGSAFVPLPAETFDAVLCGDGVVPANASNQDYVVRVWRGEAGLYLARAHARPVKSLGVLVYSRAHYLADPDKDAVDPLTGELTWDAVNQREDIAQITRWVESGWECPETVIVGVFASGQPGPPPLARRALVHNIAGGNSAYLPATAASPFGFVDAATGYGQDSDAWAAAMVHDVALLHEWIAQARATDAHERHYRVVAD